ncbi:helix-turn-helix domain-containing protein [Thermus sp. PS18]|uniref:helix-turn-helix domain-containing protein n=1 Tax=Thermus sp. PS18 TaxID=2849039 RepID=UPI00226502BC|nr:helix-turn-helix domain-containing protein [Thermus sp. PS18]UZX16531.1 helix-turn-helix domain-containing protein [Thermus sp. PS18]
MPNLTPIAYNLRQAAEVLGIGESTLRALIRGGHIRVAHVGRRVLVPHSALVEFLERGGVDQVLYGHQAVRKARVEALA